METKKEDAWLKVFCPNARCLTEEEVAALPEEKLKMMGSAGSDGIWLELPYEPGTDDSEEEGFWLRFFCPGDQCIADEPSDLP
jgi:hypothetical protein